MTAGIRWAGRRARLAACLLALPLVPALVGPWALADDSSKRDADRVAVVVVERPGAGDGPERLVRGAGGATGRQIPLIDGFAAEVPERVLGALRRHAGVRSVTVDRPFELSTDDGEPQQAGTSLELVRQAVGAELLDAQGVNGSGVDVALVDSGIAPVDGLADAGKVVNGPDFSTEAAHENLRSLDAFGHGTHMAGIIAGRDAASGFAGVAPGARIVSVKVAAHDGSTTLSRLLSGIDWVVRHGHRDGLNVRVLNLSFGADVEGGYRNDPLAFAVEQAWQRGIVVVAAAGNGGVEAGGLDSPAHDPYVVAVGGDDLHGTADVADDEVPGWSSRGDGTRNPDVVAPGTSIVSLRVPGSFIDEQYPEARSGASYFRGTGTSQAAAVTSGALALLLDARPELEPDEAKALLAAHAVAVTGADDLAQGHGRVDVQAAASGEPVDARQRWKRANLGGGWQRGVVPRPQLADGAEWPSASRWSASRWSASRWSASRWSASRWSASRWSASRWSASRWSASRWSADSWGGDAGG